MSKRYSFEDLQPIVDQCSPFSSRDGQASATPETAEACIVALTPRPQPVEQQELAAA